MTNDGTFRLLTSITTLSTKIDLLLFACHRSNIEVDTYAIAQARETCKTLARSMLADSCHDGSDRSRCAQAHKIRPVPYD